MSETDKKDDTNKELDIVRQFLFNDKGPLKIPQKMGYIPWWDKDVDTLNQIITESYGKYYKVIIDNVLTEEKREEKNNNFLKALEALAHMNYMKYGENHYDEKTSVISYLKCKKDEKDISVPIVIYDDCLFRIFKSKSEELKELIAYKAIVEKEGGYFFEHLKQVFENVEMVGYTDGDYSDIGSESLKKRLEIKTSGGGSQSGGGYLTVGEVLANIEQSIPEEKLTIPDEGIEITIGIEHKIYKAKVTLDTFKNSFLKIKKPQQIQFTGNKRSDDKEISQHIITEPSTVTDKTIPFQILYYKLLKDNVTDTDKALSLDKALEGIIRKLLESKTKDVIVALSENRSSEIKKRMIKHMEKVGIKTSKSMFSGFPKIPGTSIFSSSTKPEASSNTAEEETLKPEVKETSSTSMMSRFPSIFSRSNTPKGEGDTSEGEEAKTSEEAETPDYNLPFLMNLLKKGIWKRLNDDKNDNKTYFMISPFFLDYFENGNDHKEWFGNKYKPDGEGHDVNSPFLQYNNTDEFKEKPTSLFGRIFVPVSEKGKGYLWMGQPTVSSITSNEPMNLDSFHLYDGIESVDGCLLQKFEIEHLKESELHRIHMVFDGKGMLEWQGSLSGGKSKKNTSKKNKSKKNTSKKNTSKKNTSV